MQEKWFDTVIISDLHLGSEISRAGDASVRVALFEAAHVIMTRVATWSRLKAWAMSVAKRRGAKRANRLFISEVSDLTCPISDSTLASRASIPESWDAGSPPPREL